MNTVFYISAAVAIISTILVITGKNAIHALLYLIVSLLSVALIFFVLGAPFVAALEVIIYAGAIMVLFVFVIMMLNLGNEAVEQERRWLIPEMWAGPSLLALILIAELVYIFTRGERRLYSINVSEPKEVGISLLGSYLIGVELASVLLLSALVGAYHLGRQRRSKSRTMKIKGEL
ncbi:MAG: NADH-quinone oxidoreductase subunit J [Nitrospirota bacterium]